MKMISLNIEGVCVRICAHTNFIYCTSLLLKLFEDILFTTLNDYILLPLGREHCGS